MTRPDHGVAAIVAAGSGLALLPLAIVRTRPLTGGLDDIGWVMLAVAWYFLCLAVGAEHHRAWTRSRGASA